MALQRFATTYVADDPALPGFRAGKFDLWLCSIRCSHSLRKSMLRCVVRIARKPVQCTKLWSMLVIMS